MNKINSAESLRGLACMVVVFSHLFGVFYPQLHNFAASNMPKFELAEVIHNSPFAFFYSGTGAVFVFFALSGYVLTLSSLKAKNKKLKLKESLIKRYPRLAIPALFSCLLMWLVLHIDVDLSKTSEWFQGFKITPIFFDALYSGTIDSFLFGASNYNPVLWTMQIELFGSLIIFFACFFQEKKIIKYIFIILSVVLAAKTSLITLLGIMSFILGHFLYFSKEKPPEFINIFFLIFGLYLCGVHNTSASYSIFESILGSRTYNVLNFLGGLLIVLATIKSNIINNLLDKNILTHLGKLSFSIYLVHIPLIYLIGIPVFNYALQSNLNFITASAICAIIVIIVTFIFAEIYSRIFDDFSINFSNKLAKIILNKD